MPSWKILFWFGLVFFKYVDRSRSRHVTTKCTMGCVISTPTFYHPDLLAVFCCDPTNNFWGIPLKPYWFRLFWGFPLRFRCFYNDPGWVRNSPLRIELVDLLNDALKAMGGWPAPRDCCGCNWLTAPPQMLEAFNKVCKKFNDAKLFDMGLQCRASINRYKLLNSNDGEDFRYFLCVLVEKKSDEKLRDVGETLEWISLLEKRLIHWCIQIRHLAEKTLAWSPREDWMTRLSPPYNEATNHV